MRLHTHPAQLAVHVFLNLAEHTAGPFQLDQVHAVEQQRPVGDAGNVRLELDEPTARASC